jgi:hypothetical protein
MLFSKPLQEITFQDLTDFCERWPEGIRVEYKQVLKTDHIPKVIASLANTVGGIWIIGVKTDKTNNLPILPIVGFPREQGVDERITQSCYLNLYPPLLPDTKIIDVPGNADNVVVVVRVTESIEAPHAIENTTRVYVRTNSTTERIDLAEIDRIDYLLKRRRDTEAKRRAMLKEMLARSSVQAPSLCIMISPQYPDKPILSGDTLYGRILSLQSSYPHIQIYCYPIRHGYMAPSPLLTGYPPNSFYFEGNVHGMIVYMKDLQMEEVNKCKYIRSELIVQFVHEGLKLAKLLLVDTITNLLVEARLDGISMCAIAHGTQYGKDLTSNYCLDYSSAAEIYVMREKLDDGQEFVERVVDLTQQLMWPFNWHNRDEIKFRINRIFPPPSSAR